MEIESHSFVTARTARFCSLGKKNAQVVWVVLHGYGQLAPYFIRHFTPLVAAGGRVVAPEGLSRFYLDTPHRRIGASWMTREERVDEIADQHVYLDELWRAIRAEHAPLVPQLNVLGFSQGVATAWRWLGRKEGPRPNRFVMWAGKIPDDATYLEISVIRELDVHVALGDNDPFAPEQVAQSQLSRITDCIPQAVIHRFSGAHHLDAELLTQLATK